MSKFRLLLLLTVLATYVLIVVGANVRATDSGLGCPDWPTCHGQVIPPMREDALTEFSHRFAATIASVLIMASAVAIWRTRRAQPRLVKPAVVAPILLVAQILLGAVTVWLELPPWIVVVHLAVAFTILGLLVWTAVAASPATLPDVPSVRKFQRLAWGGVAAVFLLLMIGAYMRSVNAGFACGGFPGCNGEVAPFGRSPLIDLHLTHRFVAYAVALHVLVMLVRGWKLRSVIPGLTWVLPVLLGTVALQILVGAGAVSSGVPVVLRVLHVAGASAVWAAVLTVASLASLPRRAGNAGGASAEAGPSAATPSSGRSSLGTVVSNYIALTKPGIISLLLVTTLAAMMVAARGMPDLGLVCITLLGGVMSAGAANTFNCYIDRDIDQLMGRTAKRPIPSGLIKPRAALLFGIALGIGSVLVLGLGANWLAAALSVCGFLYYVLVYTCWLKRSTPSNIVLGGAAGAVPPLVGWAAVTGEVSLLAVYLFAVIFLWTPPHFWALALMIRKEYEKAQVPMLPIARGDAETRRQIVVYSIILVGFTLLVAVIREVGVFYMVAAASLGGLFLYHAARVLRDATNKAARGMFRYSILYLALLFLALVIDRWHIA